MHIEQIHFDEVFDVQPSRGDFSFRTRGRAHYGVNLHSGVVPHAGSSFAVAFEQPGNWDSVLGCRDLASRHVMLRRPGWWSVLLGTGDLLLLGPAFLAGGLFIGGLWPALVFGALLLLAVAYVLVHGIRLNRAVTQALLHVGEEGPRLGKPGALPAATMR